jgi:hypothetical protein
MTIRITHIRLSEGTTHEHVVHLWWTNPANSETGDNTKAAIVGWIDNQNGAAYVQEPGTTPADVGTVDPGNGRARYLRTYADGAWNNNLLSLPRK